MSPIMLAVSSATVCLSSRLEIKFASPMAVSKDDRAAAIGYEAQAVC